MLCSCIDLGIVRNEIRDNANISCPAEFNDTAFRYSVNLTWTLPISPIILESINRFIIRTLRVNALNPSNITGFFGDPIQILHTVRLLYMPVIIDVYLNTTSLLLQDPSRTSYSFPITYAPIFLPNTAYTITVSKYA